MKNRNEHDVEVGGTKYVHWYLALNLVELIHEQAVKKNLLGLIVARILSV